MKTPHTLVAATLMAVPALALSQAMRPATSSVEIYGRIDLSVNQQKTSGTATTASQNRTFVSPDTPWIGFRGSEDLGGGLRAFFKIEHGFQADTGALSSPVPGQFWNREALVGLSHTTFGAVRLGSQFTPSLMLTARLDPFGRSNTGAIFPMFQQGLAGPLGYPAVFNNSVQVLSPVMAGLQAKVLLAASEGAAPGGRPLSTALEYSWANRLFVGASYDRFKIAGAAVGRPTVPSVDQTTVQLGATYRFDPLKLHGYVIRSRVDGAPGMKGGMLGVSVPVGVGEIAASVLRRNAEDAANSDARTVALQYTHFLSKRTLVYVGGARQTNDGNAAFGVWPSRLDAGLPPPGADVTGYQVGMRHYF